MLDVVDFFFESLFQGFPFLVAEIIQLADCLRDSLFHRVPLLCLKCFQLILDGHVGQSEQDLEPVGRFWNASLFSNCLDFFVIVLNSSTVDGGNLRCCISLYPYHEIDFSTHHRLCKHLADFYFLLTIRRSHACEKIQRLTIQRVNLHMYLFLLVGYDCLSVACH